MTGVWMMIGLALAGAGEVQAPLGELAALGRQCVGQGKVVLTQVDAGWVAISQRHQFEDGGRALLDLEPWSCEGEVKPQREAENIGSVRTLMESCEGVFAEEYPDLDPQFYAVKFAPGKKERVGLYISGFSANADGEPVVLTQQHSETQADPLLYVVEADGGHCRRARNTRF